MKKNEWAYRVVVSTSETDVAYEGHFKWYACAERSAKSKMEQLRRIGISDAVASIYGRYDGSVVEVS